jgi:AbiV family abortive infection protein
MEPTPEIVAKNKTYYDLPKETIFIGLQECRKNSESLYKSAVVVAETQRNFGAANSLMILAAEECIKGVALLSIYLSVQVPFLVQPLFYSHSAKHLQGKELTNFIRVVYGALTIPLLLKMKLKDAIREAFNMLVDSVYTDFEEWWDSANNEKNNGFYVRLDGNDFISPQSFTADDFQKSRGIIKMFIESFSKVEGLKVSDYKLSKSPNT